VAAAGAAARAASNQPDLRRPMLTGSKYER